MPRVCIAILIASAVFAQKAPDTSGKPPAELDSALRARVNQFFQYEVEGKFRQAEELVAEKDKDFFVAANKPRYTAFSIKRITYSDNFTRATVFVDVDRLMAVPGFEGHPVPAAIPSRWMIENGKWCWYVDPADLRDSLMPMPGRAPLPGGIPPAAMPPTSGAATLPPMPNMTAALRVDKSALELKSGAPSSGQVKILNPLISPVTLVVSDPKVAGLEVKLDRPELKPGESAVLRVESNGTPGPPAQPVTITVRVRQTNQLIPIKVSFAK